MKIRNYLLILLSIITISCSNNRNETFHTDESVIICGEIRNYIPKNDYQSILIRVNNILKSAHHVDAHLVSIDSITGYFKTSFTVNHDSPLIFDYGDFRLNIVGRANDSIYISFDNNDLIDRESQLIIPESFEISSNYPLNRELVELFKLFSFTDFHIKPPNPAGCTNEKYLEILKQKIDKKEDILAKSIKQIDASQDLLKYIKNSLVYGAANYIIDFKIMNKESYDRDTLYDFSLFPLNNPFAINEVCYPTFLYNYFMDIFWSNDTIVNLYKEENIESAYRKYFKIIESSPTDQIIKDILFSSSLVELIALDKTAFLLLYPDIIGLIKNHNIMQFIKLTYSETIEHLGSQNNSSFGLRDFESLLNEIGKDLKKEYYLVDIWNPTCGPCVTSFPKLTELSNEFSNSNIGVLYLCTPYDETMWVEFIENLQSKKGHYLLNKKQYDKMRVDLKFSGIPKYFLMDNRGTIINNDLHNLTISEIRKIIENYQIPAHNSKYR